jgi:zinc protease
MAASPQVIVAYAKPNYPHPDDAALTVAGEILSGSSISPLYVELVKKRQLAAGISQEEGPGIAYPNLLMFGATVKSPHTTEQLIRAFDTVLERFKRTGPTQSQVDIAKRSIGMQYLGQLQSSQSLALDFASSELLFGSWRASVEWYDKMSQVTVDDVKRVVEKYLVTDRRTIATVERSS